MATGRELFIPAKQLIEVICTHKNWYPPSQRGHWHPITSTLNWCEEDYYATRYVAELINTFTNLLFLRLAWRGVKNCRLNSHDRIFLISFYGYGLVGMGSFLFHATLKYSMQLVDELSMIYTACFMFYASFTHFRDGRFNLWLAVSLIALATFITLYYHYLQDPTFHQNAYTLLTIIILSRNMILMETQLRPMSKKESSHDPQGLTAILSRMWIMVAVGITTFLTGFFLWTIDNEFCSTLIKWRHQLGLPWGLFLEGHGWWHLMTGVGAYFYIVWVTWLRYCLKGKHREYRLVWPSIFFSMPEVVKTSPRDSKKPAANGATKGHRKHK